MSVYRKLQECRVKLQSSKMKKSGHNKFAGYEYFELGDFLAPINQLFHEAGLCSVVSFTAELASLRVIDVEDNSEVVFTSPMAEANLKGCHPIQNLGAVETYQRRYLYMAALEIVEHEAIDSSKPLEESPKEAKKPVPESAKSVSQDAWDKMDAAQQAALEDISLNVIAILTEDVEKGPFQAVAYIDQAELSTDEKAALWSRFDSKQRAAMKKAAEANKLYRATNP